MTDRGPDRAVLLYDGDCDFCLTWVRRLQRWDWRHGIQYVPSRQRATVPGLPPLSDADLGRAMHLVLPDGSVYAGGRAVGPLLKLLPGGFVLRPFLRLPGAQALADRAYRWIAARRHRFGCGSACRWHASD